MIRLHCTKKILAKLPLDSSDRLKRKLPLPHAANDGPESPLSGWHANLLTIQRRSCVLFVHDSTCFPVLATCLTKPDFAELDWWFQDALMNTLLKSGANEAQMDAAAGALSYLTCDSECDRSVQATMNRMGQDLEHQISYDRLSISDLAPYRTGAWLADRPYTVKGVKGAIWPQREMLALLDTIKR
ncbi:hypothetical protein MARLIPOL_03500 [Marinobacter lipolyticus SM19]|uniref:DUF6933 domain-containing protein n=1 Tax=Marinobacter lipolyticus SM19 TaxID=1318628 RepID=R8B3B3_9GAMM|nr:hypothetical protein [Marinobacter lipolyticus]EON93066.1 hypothetical protein MARLIPOL_03500 [Marinobacter lipolyticus SM19]